MERRNETINRRAKRPLAELLPDLSLPLLDRLLGLRRSRVWNRWHTQCGAQCCVAPALGLGGWVFVALTFGRHGREDNTAKKQKREPPQCIFCGPPKPPNRMSDEHFWSDWMGDLLPKGNRVTLTRQIFSWAHHTTPREASGAQRQQRLSSKKFPVVCRNCNSGWMSRLEDQVRPFLEPMIQGRFAALNADRQRLLAEWLALKTFVFDYERMERGPHFVIQTQAERTAFMTHGQMPPGFRAWIGYGVGDEWAVRASRARALSLTLPTPLPPDFDPTGIPKNVHSITWGVGNLRVFITSTVDSNVYRGLGWTIPSFIRLWPAGTPDFIWPPRLIVSDGEMLRLTDALQDYLALVGKRPP